jgi:hypothetical protein
MALFMKSPLQRLPGSRMHFIKLDRQQKRKAKSQPPASHRARVIAVRMTSVCQPCRESDVKRGGSPASAVSLWPQAQDNVVRALAEDRWNRMRVDITAAMALGGR